MYTASLHFILYTQACIDIKKKTPDAKTGYSTVSSSSSSYPYYFFNISCTGTPNFSTNLKASKPRSRPTLLPNEFRFESAVTTAARFLGPN